MASEKIYNLENRKTYIINADRRGENSMSCPVCSGDRKKKNVKCMSFNTVEGVGHCNHCNARFVRKVEDQEVQRYTRPVPTSNPTALPDKIVNWFKERGINSSTLIDFNVEAGRMFFPQVAQERNCIMFNYYRDGELINIKYRDAEKNFRLVKDAELVFYNLDSISQDFVVITEGELDAMAYHQVGITSVVSVPNGASKNNRLQYVDNCIDRFEDVKTIYLATDDDEPGRILQEELARRFGKDRCRKISFFGKKDANELLMTDPLMLPETLEAAEEYPLEGIVTIDGIADDIWRLRREGLKPGCDISIDAFNELLTFVPGYVTGVTGIPNHGKSEFLDQIMVDLSVRHGWRFGIFSPENYPLQLHFSKVASKLVGTAFNDMGDREIIAAMNYCRDNFFYIAPEEDNSLDSIIEHAKSLVKKYGINAIIIDAWNKLEHNYQTSETQHISKELDKLISFCRKYSVHAFVVAHPTKMSRDPKTQQYNVATLYDMAGCHDEETEVLTNDGWKRHVELDGSEEVACFDLESETLKYLRPSDYHVYPYKGEMHHFKGKSMDIMVSPNHRMVIGKTWKNKSNRKPSKYNNQKWNFIYASDISKSPVVMPKSAELVSNTFVKHMKFDNGEIYDNEKLAYFLGWYLSEGSISMNSISICQALQNSANLKKSFTDLNLHVKESQFQGKKGEKEMYRFRVYAKSHPELIKWIINSFGNGASDKRIPVEFFNMLGKRGKELLMESLIEGDGSKTKNGFKYHTASKQLADDVCRLAVELGYKTIVGHYPSTNPKWLDKYVVYLTKDKPTEWIMPANQNKVEYDGNIYCLTVPTGAYVTRRNGKVAITGNSAHFYNKCDNGISVYRHFFEDGGSMPEIFVQKVKFKHWGRQGSREMQYDIPSGRYYIVGKLNKTSYLSTEFNQQEFEL